MKQLKTFLAYIRYGFIKIPIYLRGIFIFAIFVLISMLVNRYYKNQYIKRTIFIPEEEFMFIDDSPNTNNTDEDNKRNANNETTSNNVKEEIKIDKANNKVEGEVKENLKSSPFLRRNNKKSKDDRSLLEISELDYVFGDRNAPVTIVEYSSFKCPYCVRFHNNIMEKVKNHYIDTKKVKYVKRIIIQKDTLAGVMLPHCAEKEKQYTLVNDLYENANDWTYGGRNKSLRKIALRNGFTDETYENCIRNSSLANKLLERQNNDLRNLNIYSTPTVFINGTKHTGSMPYEEFASKIDKELQEVKR